MTPLFRKFLGLNWLLVLNMVGLLLWGIYAIYNASSFRESVLLANKWRDQAQWAALGLVVFTVTALVDYKWVRWGSWFLYIIGLMGLTAVKLFGEIHNGAKSWLKVGPIEVEPSQFAIVGVITALAVVLGEMHRLLPGIFRYHWLRLAVSGVLAAIPMVMVLTQPDLGSSAVYGPVVISMFLLANIPYRYLVVLFLLVAFALPLAYFFKLKDYQRARIEVFYKMLTNQKVDIQKDAYMADKIQMAVGSAGLEGKGPLSEKVPDRRSVHRTFYSATESINDFIFSVIIEEFGFQGAVIEIAATAFLLLQCIFVAFYARDHVGRLVVIGVTGMIAAHSFQNMGMNLLMMPITGIPLPFISYGGTFLIVCFFLMGLVQSVWIHRNISPVKRTAGGSDVEDEDDL